MDAMTTDVRVFGLEEDVDHASTCHKLGRRLAKSGRCRERSSVRLPDVNGPRGGDDQQCRIEVVLTALASVVIERRHAQVQAAVDTAVHAATEAVRRIV